jgi:hypothetical protein
VSTWQDAPIVPQNSWQQAPEVPSTEPPQPSTGQQVEDYAANLGKTAARMVGQGAISAVTFIPDIATEMANVLPGKKDELPSSFWNRKLDEILPPPQSTVARGLETAGSMLVGGALAGAATGERAVAQQVSRGVKSFEESGQPLNRIRTKAAEDVHTAGYDLPPAYIGGPVTKAVQSAANKARVNRDFSRQNEEITDRLAKLSISLTPDKDLTEVNIRPIKEEAWTDYEEARKVGVMKSTDAQGKPDPFFDEVNAAGARFRLASGKYTFPEVGELVKDYHGFTDMDSSQAVDDIRTLRESSRLNLATRDPPRNALGYTQRQIADALERRVDRAAEKVGIIGLRARVQDARTRLAKIHAVEDAMVGDHVSAMEIRRMRNAGTRLTDSLNTIADMATYFPDAVQLVSIKGEEGAWSRVDFLLGGTGAVTGHGEAALIAGSRAGMGAILKGEGLQKKMIQNLRPGPLKRARQATSKATGKVLKPAAKAAIRGALIMTPESLGTSPDLGDQTP